MTKFEVHSVGSIHSGKEGGTIIQVDENYIPALQALDGFSHLQIIWWFDGYDEDVYRTILKTKQPYKKAPEEMGIFATRSPIRPNPIALTAVEKLHIDYEKGVVQIAYIDANDGSPVLDIKPYTPSLDRIEAPEVPAWCAHWPKSLEESGSFAWEKEFNF